MFSSKLDFGASCRACLQPVVGSLLVQVLVIIERCFGLADRHLLIHGKVAEFVATGGWKDEGGRRSG